MTRTLSLLLDFVRLSAALVVLASHYGPWLFNIDPQVLPGWDAVIVFFVLSGFVIAYVQETRCSSLSDYTLDRLARIWSIAIPASALGLAVVLIMSGRPGAMEINTAAAHTLAVLSFTGEGWGGIHAPYNSPMWSLHYEAWYYAAFAAWTFAPTALRVPIVALCAVLAGPGPVVLAPCWLLGVALYRYRMRLQVRPATAHTILICAIALYALAYLNHTTPALRDWLKVETHGYSYVLGAATPVLGGYLLLPIIALLFVGMMNLNQPGWVVSRFQWLVRAGADLTLSIYLFHEPVFFLIREGLRLQPDATVSAAALAVLSFVTVVVLGALLEPRRKAWRRGLALLFGAFWKARLQLHMRP